LNLMHAAYAAGHSDIAEVMVCMFGPTSDEYGFLHRGTRVRKMHSSYRSTFRTIGDIPLAKVTRDSVEILKQGYNPRRKDKKVKVLPYFEEKVSIVYYYPNMLPDIIDSLVDNGYRGIVIAGTGLGHVNKPLYPALERATEKGVAVYMTVQTLWGYVHMYVYETGRDMIDLGVIPAHNMLPELYQHPRLDFNSVLANIRFKKIPQDEILGKVPFLWQIAEKSGISSLPKARIRWMMGELHQPAVGNMPLAELKDFVAQHIAKKYGSEHE